MGDVWRKLKPLAAESWSFLNEIISNWSRDNAGLLAAAIAFYAMLSVAPLLILAVSVSSLIFGSQNAHHELILQLHSFAGREGTTALNQMTVDLNHPSTSIAASVAGGIALLLGASGVFMQLRAALNAIWNAAPKQEFFLLAYLKQWLSAILVVVITGAIIIVSIVSTMVLSAVDHLLVKVMLHPYHIIYLWRAGNILITYVVITLLFAMLFKIVPDVVIGWKDALIGAIVTAALFDIGKYALDLYFRHTTVGSLYGAAGSLVVFLLWIYYSSQIFLFGAEFTHVYARRHGRGIRAMYGEQPGRQEKKQRYG